MPFFGADLAIDLGTANTCVYVHGRGVVLNEPSVVAFNTAKAGAEAIGAAALEMLGRTPVGITAIHPMKDGVIADFEAAEVMLAYFMKKARNGGWGRPRVVVGVPSDVSPVERRAVRDSAFRAKAREVYLIEEPVAAALGAGMPIAEAAGNMIVDIGGGTTDIAVISLAGLVYGRSVRVAGNAMDAAIMQHMKKVHNLLIGERTAERVKLEIGSAAALAERLTMQVKGRHLSEGVPTVVTVSDSEIREALSEPVRVIVDAVRHALERIPPELSADISDRGIVLTGGAAMLRNLDHRLRAEVQLPVQIAEDPLSTVVLGAGQLLNDVALLKKFSAA